MTPLGNLLQCLSALTGENLFLILNLDFPSFNLFPFPLVLSLQPILFLPIL